MKSIRVSSAIVKKDPCEIYQNKSASSVINYQFNLMIDLVYSWIIDALYKKKDK